MLKIESLKDGPYKVEISEGRFSVEKEGKEEAIEKNVIYLCRCGGSNNKPFCDGTHAKIGFKADSAIIRQLE